MTSVEIYIKIGTEFKRIDLFKDEKISLNSSVQNINDLSKVFTDYTQSFTIPASKNNNLIFNYWNESGINDGFDQRIRYDAIIELNTIPFKKGQIQIEKCNEKNNRIESYSITFYGKVKQLKDLFKEDKLTNLDYSSITHAYNATEVINRIDGTTTDDVYYPIVGNQHKYSFADGGANDITVGGGLAKSVEFNDLFPAIPVSKVFEFIENKYNITFTSSLFDSSYWTELYLYCKNIEKFTNYSNAVVIDWNSVNNTFPELNLTTNKYYLKSRVYVKFDNYKNNDNTQLITQLKKQFVSNFTQIKITNNGTKKGLQLINKINQEINIFNQDLKAKLEVFNYNPESYIRITVNQFFNEFYLKRL
jgi:hypothetical protein